MNSLADFTGLIETFKQAALDAVRAKKPTEISFGRVINIEPLQINVEQKMTLEAVQLILCRNVTDYTVEMSVAYTTDGVLNDDIQHQHEYAGRKQFTVHNGLVVGDEVVLIRLQGGQRFLVIDRLG